jgi:hypothetical protein
MAILAQTVQLAFRIAIVKQGALLVPYNRLGFWTCLLPAVTATVLVMVRAMLADIGGGSFN